MGKTYLIWLLKSPYKRWINKYDDSKVVGIFKSPSLSLVLAGAINKYNSRHYIKVATKNDVMKYGLLDNKFYTCQTIILKYIGEKLINERSN